MMQMIDAEGRDIAAPVSHLGAEQAPECEVADMIGAAQADALELDDASITRREIAPAAAGGTGGEIDAIAGAVVRKQGGLHISPPALVRASRPHGKVLRAQPLADHLQRGVIPDLDADAGAVALMA